jgi:hypothetical protein
MIAGSSMTPLFPNGEWARTGQLLWNALSSEIARSPVRFVCPVPESDRAGFARTRGLHLQSDTALASALQDAGYRRHCGFFDGTIEPARF